MGTIPAPGTLCLSFQPMTRDQVRRQMATFYARPVKGQPNILVNGVPIPKADYVRELNAHLERWIDTYTKRGGGYDKLRKRELPALDLLPDGRLKRHLEPTMTAVEFHKPVDPKSDWLPPTAFIDEGWNQQNIVHVPQSDLAPVLAAKQKEHRQYSFVRREDLEKENTQ
jgi:hypothetical protein